MLSAHTSDECELNEMPTEQVFLLPMGCFNMWDAAGRVL